jgi:hypothetical protein
VNDNQLVNLFENHIMICIICHSEIIPHEFFAIYTRCKKGFIAYHKFNGIIAMKIHVEFDHSTLLQKFLEDPTNLAPRSPLDHEPIKKRACMYLLLQFLVFFSTSKFKKDDAIQVVLLEDLMLFVIRGLMLMKTVESIWF